VDYSAHSPEAYFEPRVRLSVSSEHLDFLYAIPWILSSLGMADLEEEAMAQHNYSGDVPCRAGMSTSGPRGLLS